MLLKHVIDLFELLDSPNASGDSVKEYLISLGAEPDWILVKKCVGEDGDSTDFIKVCIPGLHGKINNADAPTLGVIGRLGGLGARPERIGFVSDGEGALVCLASAAKLIDMHTKGDVLEGDVILCTHICPDAPSEPHEPVAFMGSPVDMATMNKMEVDPDMDAILSVDTTKGNRIINDHGFAISPTVKDGYIMQVSDDLLDLVEIVSGDFPRVLPITDQDITPYGNGLFHINSILQPATSTSSPVVGVAITSRTAVPGCATGATSSFNASLVGRFVLEVTKAYTQGKCAFYSHEQFTCLEQKYGSRRIMQTLGKED